MCPQRLPLPFFLQNIPSTVVKATLHIGQNTSKNRGAGLSKAHYHLKAYALKQRCVFLQY